MNTYRITIKGTVQGVGFRPFIYQLAVRYSLNGTVLNGTQGVEIILNAAPESLQRFLQSIEEELPPLASVETVETTKIAFREFRDFQIISTDEAGERTVRIPPDVSICKACETELFDPNDRRYGYPFITCTHCGVRYSIIYDLPYDRKNTSMKFFEMCDRCEKEYSSPLDRRYHAQPIGCYQCGPTLELKIKNEKLEIDDNKIVETASQLLSEGKILAVKGVGGYHLMCDATNEAAVKTLRERKHRPTKPFAVMVKDMEMAKWFARIDTAEEKLLRSKERPIVLLKTQPATRYSLPTSVAPNIAKIGLFLPYTPLHLLLLNKLDRPLVATSANITDEPICTDMDSLEKLNGVYDYVLDHDRKIVNGCDDSVVMVVGDQQVILRRARGYAPASIKLPFRLKQNRLAMGANQKSTVAIGFEDTAILSPHIGDLDSIGSVEYYKKNIETLERIYDFTPEVIVHDKHPYYESTKYAKQLFTLHSSLFIHEVQHHYAHILGVMAEKGIEDRVLGVAFDGTGYGNDGNLWGGEFLVCDYEGFERVAHLDYFKLLGGAKAIKEPRRVALSLLFDLYGEEALKLDTPTVNAFSSTELKTYFIAWQKGLNAPLSSSAGRLFDAVASLRDVCHVMSFEGESGMLLEELYDETVKGAYSFEIKKGRIDILPMIKEIVGEKETAVAVSKFFHTLVEMVAAVYEDHDDLPLVLSGGVFQNSVLLDLMLKRFPDVYIPTLIPPNDGGIALGQLASRLKR
ncbi:carbamoyltransferase HypF [Sulfurovum riftiae]|uniref:Carbamoyltransferase n=1 Tax=Sulfurovum riftiae TaxID=1630136 RepID=A0A151CIX8_9BACT|nr:carbamoyltransferase HypF [Sulfurovum riftiae]KYJ87476.1 carbamoyltransferase HypF [Sulfurovum riftiae]